MASDFSWSINGLAFATAFGPLFLTDATLWRPPVSVRRTSVVIPGQHGTISPGLPVYEEPKVTLVLRSRQATQTALEEAVTQAVAILTQPTITLTRVSGAVTATCVAQLESITPDDFTYAKSAKIVAVFAVPGVFLRGAVTTGTDLAFASDLTNQEITHLSGSSGPVTDAVIRITGPATSVSVTDPGTATGVSWAGTLTAGQYLYLSGKPLAARISSSNADWASGGTDVSGQVSYPASGRLQLWPVVQSATTRKVLLSATGAGRSAATKLCVRAGASFL